MACSTSFQSVRFGFAFFGAAATRKTMLNRNRSDRTVRMEFSFCGVSPRAPSCRGLPLTLLLVIDIDVFENCRGAREAIVVVVMRHGDAGDQHGHPRRFRAIEFRFFEIDVVN